ncbi:MAG: GWxTD domain-containing protein [Chitinophagaceae bacterium]|nr:MAG: GWxTD domain-containing protein [Chitinophagaceae bacterium]
MKKLIYSLSILFFLIGGSFHAHASQIWVQNNTFLYPGVGSYVETNIQIPGRMLTYVENENGNYQGSLEITMLFKKDSLIVNYDRYILHSPEYEKEDTKRRSLLDKKKFMLDKGEYTFKVQINDVNNREAVQLEWSEPLVVDYADKEAFYISDLTFLEAFEQRGELADSDDPFIKNGVFMQPQIVNFFPGDLNRLQFYVELYNAEKALGDDFLISYSILRQNGNLVPDMKRVRRMSSSPFHGLLGAFNISNLPSGNYNLLVEARDRNNEVIESQKTFFQRSNPDMSQERLLASSSSDLGNTFVGKYNKEEMAYLLRAMLPIAEIGEDNQMRNLIREPGLERMQLVLYNFWRERDASDPEQAFKSYMEEVQKVNNSYGTNIEYGFETDRGRVYLRYGVPSNMQRAPREPGAMPYEVWNYYAMDDGQTNVRFIFYNPDLVSNNYELIHSTARGETYDPRWRMKIYNSFQMTEGGSDLDRESFRDHFGSKLEDFIRE